MTGDSTVAFLLDQLDDPGVTARSMFGGHGVYRGGRMFGIVYEDIVYMKMSEAEAKASGREPFRPRASQTLWSYREVTADELEDRDALAALARDAQRAAAGGD